MELKDGGLPSLLEVLSPGIHYMELKGACPRRRAGAQLRRIHYMELKEGSPSSRSSGAPSRNPLHGVESMEEYEAQLARLKESITWS